jgi:penicillin-insensitive murein endopeptidase
MPMVFDQANGVIMKLITFLAFMLYSGIAFSVESTCYGTTSNGYLSHGVQLPAKGKNYISYSTIANTLGRTYLHSKARKIIIESYKKLEKERPKKKYKYAETGFKKGGRFKPHKTHRNGLSVDFMVPVVNKKGKSVHFPTNPLNKFGYSVEFDKKGNYKSYSIDYEAMAAHIVQLHKTSVKNGANLWRVIFDPKLQPFLLKTKYGKYIQDNIKLSKKRSWVRHDEHYHVDFLIKCQPLKNK